MWWLPNHAPSLWQTVRVQNGFAPPTLKKFAPAGYENYEIRPTIGMQEPKYYRAKLQFQTRKFKNQVKAGLYAQNSHYLVELKDCLVQDKETQVIANRLAELLTYHQIPITDERKRSVFAL